MDDTAPAPSPGPTSDGSRRRAPLVDAAIVAAWFGVAGLVGAVVWHLVVDLPEVTRTGDTATLAPDEVVRQVAIDGWFVVIAAVGGLLSGLLLLAWRHRDPLLSVVLVTLGGGLASWVMIHLGRVLGPGDPTAALRTLPDGATVSQQLRLHATGSAWVWAIAAAFGALIYLWVLAKPGGSDEQADSLP